MHKYGHINHIKWIKRQLNKCSIMSIAACLSILSFISLNSITITAQADEIIVQGGGTYYREINLCIVRY